MSMTATDGYVATSDVRSWLDAVSQVVRAVNDGMPLDELLLLVTEMVQQLAGYDFCAVLMADPMTEALHFRASRGLSEDYVKAVNVDKPLSLRPGPLGDAPSSRAFRSRRPVVVADMREESAFYTWEGLIEEQGFLSMASVPFLVKGQTAGVINGYTRELHDFSAEEVMLLETLANHITLAIEGAELRREQRETIHSLQEANRSLTRQRHALARVDDIHRALMDIVLDERGLTALAAELARTVSAPVLIADRAGRRIAGAAFQGRRPELPCAERELRRHLSLLSSQEDSLSIDVDASEKGLLVPVRIGDELVGCLWAIEGDEPFGGLEIRTLETAGVVTALEMLKERAALEVELRVSRDLLGEMLAGDDGQFEALLPRARQMEHDLQLPHDVIVIRSDMTDEQRSADADNDGASVSTALLGLVNGLVRRGAPRPVVATNEGHVVVLWPRDTGEQRPEAAEIAKKIQRNVRSVLVDKSVSVALGGPCLRPDDYRRTYRTCLGALSLAERAGLRDHLCAIEDLGIFQLLLQVEDPNTLLAFVRTQIGALLDYDAARGNSLVPTLREYLQRECSTAATAEALYVHPNTVTYRLRRIEQLLDCSLGNSSTLMEIQLALAIESMLGSSSATR